MRNKPHAHGGTVLQLYHLPSLTSLYMRIPGCSYYLALFHLPLYLESCINNKRVNLHLITYSLELQMHRIYRAISVHVIIQLTLKQEGSCLNCMGPLIHGYLSIVNTFSLHGPCLIESSDAEEPWKQEGQL